jgi:ABC-type polysaccharide/polyol phosphate export permease
MRRSFVFLSILALIFVSFISSVSISNPEWIAEEASLIKESIGRNLITVDYILQDLFQNNFQNLCVFGIFLFLTVYSYNLQIFKKFTILRE